MSASATAASELEGSADPAASALLLERVATAHPGADVRIVQETALRLALVAIGAASPWLSRVCATDSAALDVLASLARPVDMEAVAAEEGGLARARRLEVLRIAARDLLGLDDLETVGQNLSALAGSVLRIAWAKSAVPGLAVIGMGKLGARELNYSSDIDLLLVASSDVRTDSGGPARRFVETVRSAWRVDLDLRPEGRAGPIVRTLQSYEAYWDRWARTWEFQALLKARAVAGDADLGAHFETAVAGRVWGRPFGQDELSEVRRLKARAETDVTSRGLSQRELKRGRGGIRDIEFAVQLLQLVHGRTDPQLRTPDTIGALRALGSGGYVMQQDSEALESAYRFLRTVEHRLQLFEDQQVHTVPPAGAARERLARVLGYRDGVADRAEAQFNADLARHQATVRSIHERLFFRPLLEAFTTNPLLGDEPSLAPAAIVDRLGAFGFADAERTRRAVADLTRGFSRTSQLMQRMLPVLFDWLSESPSPDLGLLGLRTLASEGHSRDILTALCRDSPEAARQLCELLGTGPRFARDLLRHPHLLNSLAQGELLSTRSRGDLDLQLQRSLAWRTAVGAVETGLRSFAKSETLRVAATDVLALTDVDHTGAALSDIAESVIQAALRAADPPMPFAVVGMGRLGGREMAYSSDLDLFFVYDNPGAADSASAAAAAEECAASVVRILSGSTPANGSYPVDTALRPEGRQGPLARSLDAFTVYYERWAQVWERQALIRGRIVAGDAELGERFASVASDFVWNRPFGPDDVREIRRTKARVEKERVPPSEDPRFHLKLGAGSLSDVEWTAQLLQLTHGVRATGTLAALSSLRDGGVLEARDAEVLVDAYRFCERARNRLSLQRGVPSDSLPTTGPGLTSLARSLGTDPTDLRDAYRRLTRRARRVVEKVFYGRAAG